MRSSSSSNDYSNAMRSSSNSNDNVKRSSSNKNKNITKRTSTAATTTIAALLGSQQSSPALNQCLPCSGATQLLYPHVSPTLQSWPVSQSPSPMSHGVTGVQQPVFWPWQAERGKGKIYNSDQVSNFQRLFRHHRHRETGFPLLV